MSNESVIENNQAGHRDMNIQIRNQLSNQLQAFDEAARKKCFCADQTLAVVIPCQFCLSMLAHSCSFDLDTITDYGLIIVLHLEVLGTSLKVHV
jgi:hypothetical protein